MLHFDNHCLRFNIFANSKCTSFTEISQSMGNRWTFLHMQNIKFPLTFGFLRLHTEKLKVSQKLLSLTRFFYPIPRDVLQNSTSTARWGKQEESSDFFDSIPKLRKLRTSKTPWGSLFATVYRKIDLISMNFRVKKKKWLTVEMFEIEWISSPWTIFVLIAVFRNASPKFLHETRQHSKKPFS